MKAYLKKKKKNYKYIKMYSFREKDHCRQHTPVIKRELLAKSLSCKYLKNSAQLVLIV